MSFICTNGYKQSLLTGENLLFAETQNTQDSSFILQDMREVVVCTPRFPLQSCCILRSILKYLSASALLYERRELDQEVEALFAVVKLDILQVLAARLCLTWFSSTSYLDMSNHWRQLVVTNTYSSVSGCWLP